MTTTMRYRATLLGLYSVWWTLLAIAPSYRQDWLLENVLVFVGVPLLVIFHRRFSDLALTCLVVFFALHALGAHYTYSEVPYDAWWQAAFGESLNAQFGFERNHYDRLVHFLYGLLVTPAAIDLLDARAPQSGIWRWLLPFLFMTAHSTIYEVIEWSAAMAFAGDLGQAYLGTQGDVWDAQRDSALAMFGTLIALLWLRWPARIATTTP
jgi:putative membrane protein